ncbi:hypothetical protein [Methanotorris igneus]|uniref:Uncharacterized protein n=1 Tax=Methanotorris igneus (strain DSM 5666 / JCM 11834 / Kol 5) TaxID=880724 RepID=F6BAA3_METIK|nr:hypothetical protein [Methanotorris igneus]AEF95793.1 hypothetical protein Metig_0236 [Methanotorris igneus Kol 5]
MDKVSFDKLVDIIFRELIPKLVYNRGVSKFAEERSKFEGWLKA